MADVVLAYASEDRRLALALADRLEEAEFSVWWDRHIHGGADFAAENEREIKAAKSVDVLGPQVSQPSKWVRDEATHARDKDRLVRLRIDGTPSRLEFREAEPFEALIQSLGRMLDPARVRRLARKGGCTINNPVPDPGTRAVEGRK